MASAADDDEVEPRGAWVVVWACFTALAVIFGVSYSFAALFEPLQQQFAATRADVSLLFGVSGLIYFVLGAGAGMLADRYGPRVVTSAGMVCIAAGLLGASWAASLTGVIVAYGLGLGVGIALVYTPAIACVQPWFTRRRGMAAGLASAGIGAGTLIGPLMVAALLAWSDWRVTLRVVAAVVLLLGLAATLLLQRAPAATAGARAVAGTPLREALASPSFRWLYAMALLASPAMFIPFAHVSAAARDLGIDELRAVGLVGLIGVGSLAGRFVIGSFADRLGRARTLVLMQGSLGLSLVLWALAGGYAAMAVFAVWMGLSYGGIVSLMPAFVMDRFGARAVSSLVGILYTGAALGNLGGPVLAGAVFDHSGSYQGVIWACLALSALATWAAAKAMGWRGSAAVHRQPEHRNSPEKPS
ncbi:MAG TPA: MFS transporter [Rubrivivax sp.]|nr:MFS transporter [Rubrivivax sp.]